MRNRCAQLFHPTYLQRRHRGQVAAQEAIERPDHRAGIYALISYSVSQRTQEIGIRIALGASAREVQRRIVGQTLRLALIGLVIGAGASWLLARAVSGLLFGVTARDPQTFLGMVAVLTAVALAAGYLPARRASRIDPMVALRSE